MRRLALAVASVATGAVLAITLPATTAHDVDLPLCNSNATARALASGHAFTCYGGPARTTVQP